MANGHGGKREGAGRKSNAARQELESLMDAEIPLREIVRLWAEYVRANPSGEVFARWLGYRVGLPVQRNENEHIGETILRVVYADPGDNSPTT